MTKLIEDSTGSKVPKTAIGTEKILEWLVDNRLLSIALEGNIDQAQYCDKIKGIVDFLGAKLSLDELTMIWKMQVLMQCCAVAGKCINLTVVMK